MQNRYLLGALEKFIILKNVVQKQNLLTIVGKLNDFYSKFNNFSEYQYQVKTMNSILRHFLKKWLFLWFFIVSDKENSSFKKE